jgi:hypothetical protein
MKPYIKIALFIVFFIALGSILAGLYYYNLKPADMAKAKPDFVMTASALVKAFEDDENGSSAKYVNKILEVTGTIVTLKDEGNNIINLSLDSGSCFGNIICTLPDVRDISAFSIGDDITVRGKCSGFLMDVLMNNCTRIDKIKR